MTDTSIGIVRQWFRERRDLARQRSTGADLGRPESVRDSSWRGLDTNSRDLAVEASLLSELTGVLQRGTEAGLRSARWGTRDRISGAYGIGDGMWSSIPDERARVGGLESIIDRLLQDALRQGIDLSDITITVRPGDAPAAVTVRLEGVKA